MDLSGAILGDPGSNLPGAEMRMGYVAAVSPQLLCIVGSSSVATVCSHLDTYRPTVGDVVVVLVSGINRCVLGTSSQGQGARIPFYVAVHGFSGTTSGGAPSLISQLTVPAQGFPGFVMLLGHVLLGNFTVGGDLFEVSIVDSTFTSYAGDRIPWNAQAAMAHPIGFIFNDGTADQTYQMVVTRNTGSGSADYFGTDPRYGMLHAVLYPHPTSG